MLAPSTLFRSRCALPRAVLTLTSPPTYNRVRARHALPACATGMRDGWCDKSMILILILLLILLSHRRARRGVPASRVGLNREHARAREPDDARSRGALASYIAYSHAKRRRLRSAYPITCDAGEAPQGGRGGSASRGGGGCDVCHCHPLPGVRLPRPWAALG